MIKIKIIILREIKNLFRRIAYFQLFLFKLLIIIFFFEREGENIGVFHEPSVPYPRKHFATIKQQNILLISNLMIGN